MRTWSREVGAAIMDLCYHGGPGSLCAPKSLLGALTGLRVGGLCSAAAAGEEEDVVSFPTVFCPRQAVIPLPTVVLGSQRDGREPGAAPAAMGQGRFLQGPPLTVQPYHLPPVPFSPHQVSLLPPCEPWVLWENL